MRITTGAVRRWLERQRRLPRRLLERCRQDRILYADACRNAVFVCRDPRSRPTGAALAGTGSHRFRAMAPGSRKARSAFWLPPSPAASNTTTTLRERHRCCFQSHHYCKKESPRHGT